MAGLEVTDFTEELSCAYPLPRLGDDPIMEPLAKKVNDLSLLSHPLFWCFGDELRPHLIHELDDDGEDTGETHPEWEAEIALRIAVELEMAGLYNPSTGEWADAWSMLGLDPVDPWVQRRVRNWQGGAPDDLLDTFNICDTMKLIADTEYVVDLAASAFPDVFFLASCSSLFSLEEFLSETNAETPLEDVAGAISIAVSVLTVDGELLALTESDLDENSPNVVALRAIDDDYEAQEPSLASTGDLQGYLAFKDRVLSVSDSILNGWEPKLEEMGEVLTSFRRFVETGEYESEGDESEEGAPDGD
jgi:hypothetical protein